VIEVEVLGVVTANEAPYAAGNFDDIYLNIGTNIELQLPGFTDPEEDEL
jgi:hypothetical protein